MLVAVSIGRDRKEKPYVEALTAAGLECRVFCPNTASEPWEGLLDGCGGLVLCGGEDIDPKLYAVPEEQHPTVDDPDATRDQLEKTLYEKALKLDMPVLGICRGVQIMNWAMGGDLYQDIDSHHAPHGLAKNHRQTSYGFARHDVGHHVSVVPDTLLSRILNGATELGVNTIHHQAVKTVAPGLVVNAVSVGDGIVEGLELPGARFCLGVQWHPECLWDKPATAAARSIFEAFAAAVKGS